MSVVDDFYQLCNLIEEVRPPEAGDSFLKIYISEVFDTAEVDLYYSISRVSIYPTYCEVSLGFFSVDTLMYYASHGHWPVFSSFLLK